MNWGRIEGNLLQMKGAIKERWGQITDDELELLEGQREKLVGVIQGHYGQTREEAEARVEFLENVFSKEPRH